MYVEDERQRDSGVARATSWRVERPRRAADREAAEFMVRGGGMGVWEAGG